MLKVLPGIYFKAKDLNPAELVMDLFLFSLGYYAFYLSMIWYWYKLPSIKTKILHDREILPFSISVTLQ